MARRIGRLAGRRDSLGRTANHGNIEWFEKKGDVALACLLWAAAVSAATPSPTFSTGLSSTATRTPCGCWPATRTALRKCWRSSSGCSPTTRPSGSVRDTIELSLAWAIIPALAAAVTPPPGQGFDLARFISQNGTLYLIASGDEDSPVTPLFRAFTSYVHYAAGLMGTLARPGGSIRRCGWPSMR